MNLVRHKLNFLAPDGVSWNWAWQKAKRLFFKTHAKQCACCGSRKHVELHHVLPRHLFPALALDQDNFIPLCGKGKGCHIHIGHLNNYHYYNANVVDVCEYVRENSLLKNVA